jgi:hypothetical protein
VIDRAVEGFRGIIGGWRDDAWPRGVQEEDRDRPWGRGTAQAVTSAPTAFIEPALTAVRTRHVESKTRVR